MTPITEKEKAAIIKNIAEVLRTNHSQKLSKQSYGFLCLASGFIAHYDHNGFCSYYGFGNVLKDDILRHRNENLYSHFHPGERDYEYYQSKADLYKRICDTISEIKISPRRTWHLEVGSRVRQLISDGTSIVHALIIQYNEHKFSSIVFNSDGSYTQHTSASLDKAKGWVEENSK